MDFIHTQPLDPNDPHGDVGIVHVGECIASNLHRDDDAWVMLDTTTMDEYGTYPNKEEAIDDILDALAKPLAAARVRIDQQ